MPKEKELLHDALETIYRLLDICEDFYPNYFSDDNIAIANDIIKEIEELERTEKLS